MADAFLTQFRFVCVSPLRMRQNSRNPAKSPDIQNVVDKSDGILMFFMGRGACGLLKSLCEIFIRVTV